MGATGTDTGGSIRQPASFCGVTGIKPTYGRCSRWGIIAFASSLDQAGPIARSVTDCAILLQAMAGYDEKDSTSVNLPVPDFKAMVDNGVDGMTIGIPEEYRVDGIPDEINQMWEDGIDWLKSAGAKVKNISLPHTEHALATYYIIAPAEASSNLARYDGVRYGLRVDGDDLIDTYQNTRSDGFGDEVQRRIMIGTYVLSAGYYDAYYNQARRVRSLIAQDFTDAFENGIDAILTPTAPSAAFEIGANTDDPVQMYLNDIFTIPTSLAGLPGMSVPAGRDGDGLPLGLQIIGRPFDEETVFRVGREIERHTDMPNGVDE
jgi:aspartyl-tRNA(Asn)/glutamyl-tRNA(Gln) amidotransferase subunit A